MMEDPASYYDPNVFWSAGVILFWTLFWLAVLTKDENDASKS